MKANIKRITVTLLISILVSFPAFSKSEIMDQAKAEQQQRLKWWKEAHFGMFVHWGLYSGLAGKWEDRKFKTGGAEWIQKRAGIDTDTYAKVAIPLFKPSENFAEQWAKVAKDAGCKYIVFTTKHHDGFCLHDSKVSEYDAGSVLHRDLVKEIVKAARDQGLRIGFYHSLIDWHHDQYDYKRARGLPYPLSGNTPYPNGKRDHKKYIKYLHAQVKELLSNYGSIDVLWWDYSKSGFQGQKAWGSDELIKMVRRLQPNIVMNNRLFRSNEAGWPTKKQKEEGIQPQLDPRYGDFSTPEQHIPPNGLPSIAWETCMTMNGTWGYSDYDHRWKSTKKLIQNLVDIVSKGGNYLLNVGPKSDGSIPEESIKRLHEMGQWLKVNGEAIYGTQATPFKEKLAFGRATQKGNKIYLHVFNWPENQTLQIQLSRKVKRAYLLANPKTNLKIKQAEGKLTLTLPAQAPDANVSVIALECAKKK